ncbi:MAG TPA: hypothetical protein VN105_14300 [Chitinophaga sp.]|nr:hypothetical protein [Chitinophaga sp.]HWV67023.1 hypothetical protein [Chitinophaga sp.]
MKRLFDPLFLTYCGLWGMIRLFRYIHLPVPLLNGYLTDFIAVPAMAHVALTFTRRYIVRNEYYTYPLYYLLFMAFYMAVVFEWVMPRVSTVYTSDVWDVAVYFGGALFYYYVHRKRTYIKHKAHHFNAIHPAITNPTVATAATVRSVFNRFHRCSKAALYPASSASPAAVRSALSNALLSGTLPPIVTPKTPTK